MSRDPGLPPGCSQRDIDEAFDGTLPSREQRHEDLLDALVEIAFSPYDIACLDLDDSAPEKEPA